MFRRPPADAGEGFNGHINKDIVDAVRILTTKISGVNQQRHLSLNLDTRIDFGPVTLEDAAHIVPL